MAYTSQLESVPADTVLYDVYGYDAPPELDGTEHLMGTLQLDGKLTKSKFGDEELFFRHQLATDDFKLQPTWKKYYPEFHPFGAMTEEKVTGKCPYMEMLKKLYYKK